MFCGVDIGSRTIKSAIYDGERIVATAVSDTGATPKENAAKLIADLLDKCEIKKSDLKRTLATGYGRNYFEGADVVNSEIICHAAGVAHLFPSAQTIIDIGGQDSKMIRTNAAGKVLDFAMNDRCAAGTGKFIEMVARTLDVALDQVGDIALTTEDSCEISSMCAVFAESEIIGLLHKGVPTNVILRGVFKSVARRTIGLSGRVGVRPEIVFTGGVAQNKGVLQALEHEFGVEIHVPPKPQITGAMGAAIIAARAK